MTAQQLAVEVWLTHNAATVTHHYTCSRASASLLLTEGREGVGLNLQLTEGRDVVGEDVRAALYADVAWVIVRPAREVQA